MKSNLDDIGEYFMLTPPTALRYNLHVLVVTTCLLILAPAQCHAWWSAPVLADSTHFKVSNDARDQILLQNDNYPDVDTSYADLIAKCTSGTKDHKRAQDNRGDRNDGPVGLGGELAATSMSRRCL